MSQTPPEGFDKRIITGGSRRGEAGLPSGQSVNDFHGRSDVDSSLFAQHHTLGTSRTQASPGDHTHDGISSKFVSLIRRTTADQTKWATQSVAEDITGLFFDTEANSYYTFEALIHCQASVDLTLNFNFTLPALATISYTNNSFITAVADSTINRQRIITPTATSPVFGVDVSVPVILIPKGVIFSGNGGRVQLRMNKAVATVGTVTVFANSTFKGEKIVS